MSSLVIAKILLLIEEVGPRRSEIDDLRTSIAILFESGALETVEGVGNTFAATDDTFVLVITERTFITDACQSRRSNVGIAHRTLPVAFVAQSADGDSGLLAAHYEVTKVE
jgi:hypothetical protein